MGDYTRLELDVLLRLDTSKVVVDVLKHMLNTNRYDVLEMPLDLPPHRFFATEQWRQVLLGSSSYHPDSQVENGRLDPVLELTPDGLRLEVISSVKNYDDEIQLFCDWIAAYLNVEDGTVVGNLRFMDEPHATQLLKDRETIVCLETGVPELYDGPGLLNK